MFTPGSESDRWYATPVTILSKSCFLFWENILFEIKFYDVSWCQISSLVTLDTFGSLHTCPGSFPRSLFFCDFWWISGVLMWGPLKESASHPLSSAGWVPQVIIWHFLFWELVLRVFQQLLGWQFTVGCTFYWRRGKGHQTTPYIYRINGWYPSIFSDLDYQNWSPSNTGLGNGYILPLAKQRCHTYTWARAC